MFSIRKSTREIAAERKDINMTNTPLYPNTSENVNEADFLKNVVKNGELCLRIHRWILSNI